MQCFYSLNTFNYEIKEGFPSNIEEDKTRKRQYTLISEVKKKKKKNQRFGEDILSILMSMSFRNVVLYFSLLALQYIVYYFLIISID